MKYALGNMLNGAGMIGSDVDARAYINAVVAAGVTVTSAQKNAINNFVKAEKAGSRWTRHKRFYFPMWANASANAICMKSLTSGTFVGGVTHASGYVQGDGTTGYFNMGVTPSALGLTTIDAGFFALINQAGSSGTRAYLACADNVANTTNCGLATVSAGAILVGSFGSLLDTSANVSVPLTHQATTGLIATFKTGGSAFIQRRLTSGNSILVTDTEGGAGTIPTVRNLYALATNYAGTAASFTDARLGSYGASGGMSSASVTDFTANLKTLWETCTGLTLP